MNTNRFSRAVTLLYQTRSVNNDQSGLVAKLISQCQINLGNYAAAEQEAVKYIAAYPEQVLGYMMLGDIAFKLNKFKDVEKNNKKVLTINPGNTEAMLNLAAIYLKAEQYDLKKACDYAQLALEYDSTFAKAWSYLGQIEELDKRFDAAIIHFQKCLYYNPNYTFARKELAKILVEEKGDFDNAIMHLEMILKADSSDAFALKSLAGIYTLPAKSDPVKSAYYVKRAEQLGKDSSQYFKLTKALSAIRNGNTNATLPMLLDYYRMDSSKIEIALGIFSNYYNQQKFDLSEYFLKRSLALDSFSNVIVYNAGYFYCYAKPPYRNKDKARYYFERGLHINPYDSLTLAHLGRIYLDLGNLREAKRICSWMISFLPGNLSGNFGLSLVYESEGKLDSAYYFYSKTNKLFPDDDYVCNRFADFIIKYNINQGRNALNLAKRAVEINPGYGDNHFLLAKVYLYFNDYYFAAKEYTEAIRLDPSLKNPKFELELNKKPN